MRRPNRAGFSLLEVILATAILLGAVIVLARLASIGTQHAVSAEESATAQWICQAKLNEILAGISPPQPVHGAALPDQPGWVYSVEIDPVAEPGRDLGLAALRITVAEDVPEDVPKDVPEDYPRKQFTLTRWIRDPYVEGEMGSRPVPPRVAPSEQSLDGGPGQ